MVLVARAQWASRCKEAGSTPDRITMRSERAGAVSDGPARTRTVPLIACFWHPREHPGVHALRANGHVLAKTRGFGRLQDRPHASRDLTLSATGRIATADPGS
jgi:hypothetical protein